MARDEEPTSYEVGRRFRTSRFATAKLLDLRCPLSRILEAVHSLDEPAAKEPPPDGEIDQTVAPTKWVHAESGIDEGAALGIGELPVNEHPADGAMHSDLAKLVHSVYEEMGFVTPD
jgi:hypothetical protein